MLLWQVMPVRVIQLIQSVWELHHHHYLLQQHIVTSGIVDATFP
jgi:hypothetical protein